MKSPTISIIRKIKNSNRPRASGFLTIDALVACAFMAMIIPAALSLSWSSQSFLVSAQKELATLSNASQIIVNGAATMVSSSTASYSHEFGKDMCTISPPDPTRGFTGADVYTPLVSGLTLASVSLTARNGFLYEVTDVGAQIQPDFFIIDARMASSSVLVSSLNTGPGLAAVAVAGHYAYVANESSLSQLQIIDIANRSSPVVVSSLKLPLPTASSTAPHASAIFYADGLVFLGTEKWDGTEFNVIDVSNPLVPHYRGGFETGTIINNIYVNNGLAYVADADSQQLRILDVHNPGTITEVSSFSPSGSAVLEGKTLAVGDYNENGDEISSTSNLYFGRAGGGFNNTSDYELFSFDIVHDPFATVAVQSHDIPGGVYGIASHNGYVFIATHDSTAPIQIWPSDFSHRTLIITSGGTGGGAVAASAMVCDHAALYSAISTGSGFQIIIPH